MPTSTKLAAEEIPELLLRRDAGNAETPGPYVMVLTAVTGESPHTSQRTADEHTTVEDAVDCEYGTPGGAYRGVKNGAPGWSPCPMCRKEERWRSASATGSG